MLSSIPQKPWWTHRLGQSLRYPNQGYCISSFVTFLGPFGTLCHLVKPESSSGKKIACDDMCLKAVDWARVLLVGRGLREHTAPNP